MTISSWSLINFIRVRTLTRKWNCNKFPSKLQKLLNYKSVHLISSGRDFQQSSFCSLQPSSSPPSFLILDSWQFENPRRDPRSERKICKSNSESVGCCNSNSTFAFAVFQSVNISLMIVTPTVFLSSLWQRCFAVLS